MSDPTTATAEGTGLLPAELALTAVTMATAAGMVRLFTSADFLPTLLVVVAAAHAVNAVVRRRRWSAWVAAPVIVAGGILVVCWLHLGSSLRAGLPTGDTWPMAYEMLHDAFAPFRELVPPVDLSPGFALTMSLTAWILATFADAAAFRGDAPLQAVIPCLAGFLFTSILADGHGEVPATAAIVAATGCWAAAWSGWQARRTRWIESAPGSGRRDLVRGGLALVAVGTLTAALAGPFLPPDRDAALIDLRRVGQGPSNRVADNPLVGVGSLLRDRSDDPLFEVTSRRAHYWRLTSLESFDERHQSWFSDQRFAKVDSSDLPLPNGEIGRVTTRTELSRFEITGLEGIWLPSVYVPRSVRVDTDVRYSPESGSMITDGRSDGIEGLSYSVSSVVTEVTPRRPRLTTPAEDDLLAVPADLAMSLGPPAAEIVRTAGARGPIGRARALQDWFRDNFLYDADADFSEAENPTLAFLRARRGFCQQFASTFALMARTLGLPTRVAVGFTFGEPGQTNADGDTTFVVRGRQAHAWPEVLVDGVGWIAFEPTPTRGNPDAEPWTGVAAAQDDGDRAAEATTTTASPTTTAIDAAASTTVPDFRDRESDAITTASSPPRWWAAPLRVALVVLAVAGFLAAIVGLRWGAVVLSRRRRRDAARTPASKVRLAWDETGEWLAAASLQRGSDETIDEFARRVGRVVPELGQIGELSRLAERRVYSVEPLDDDDAALAERAAAQLGATVAAGMTRRERIAHELRLPRRHGGVAQS